MTRTRSVRPPAATGRWLPRRTYARLAVLVAAIVGAAVAQHFFGSRHNFLDLRIYDGAVRWWARGRPLYDYAVPDPVQGTLGFTYPPFAALVMYPMAWLPSGVVIVGMWLATAAATAVATAWLLLPVTRRFGWPTWYALGLALPLVSVLEPIRETLAFGQINVLLELLVLVDLLYLVPRGSRFAGVAIGVATAVKLTPAIFIVYLLTSRRIRAAGTAVLAFLAAGLLAAVVDGRDSWLYWSDVLWRSGRIGHLDGVPNQSLLGALARLSFPAQPDRRLWAVLVLVVLGFGLWRAGRAARGGDAVAGLTLAGLTGALISPVSWQHHLVWFVPALVVLLDHAASAGAGTRVRRGYALLGAAVWLTVTFSVIAWFDWGIVPRRDEHTPYGLLVADWHVLLMLVLLVLLPVRWWAGVATDTEVAAPAPPPAGSTRPGHPAPGQGAPARPALAPAGDADSAVLDPDPAT